MIFLQKPEFATCVPALGASPDYKANNLASASDGMAQMRDQNIHHFPAFLVPFPASQNSASGDSGQSQYHFPSEKLPVLDRSFFADSISFLLGFSGLIVAEIRFVIRVENWNVVQWGNW